MRLLFEDSKEAQLARMSSRLKWICRVLETNFPKMPPLDNYELDGSTIPELADRVDSIAKYIEAALPIEKIPKATGDLRKHQNEMLRLLIAFDKLCKSIGVKYWLDYGTLIGAMRHKGFIPWDDDLDVSMMGDDWEKLKRHANLCDKYHLKLNSECFPVIPYVELSDDAVNKDLKTTPWLDIFIFHKLDPSISEDDGKSQAKKEMSKLNMSKKLDLSTIKRQLEICKRFNKSIEAHGGNKPELLFRGLECCINGPWESILVDDVFPLGTCKFEGHNLPVPGQAAMRLEHYKGYGKGWNAYPVSHRMLPKHRSQLHPDREPGEMQTFLEWIKEH